MKAFTGGGSGRLNVPWTLATASQAQFFDDFTGAHGLGQVLLISEDQEDGVTKFVFIEHSVEFVASDFNTITVVAINYENDTLRVVVVVTP